MRYQIYEAKSVKYDAQQRVGVKLPHPVDGRSAGGLRSSSPVTKIKKGENND